jgi:hypothetical protein
MNDDSTHELSSEEREAFRSLESERVYSIQREDRIVQALKERGLIQEARARWWAGVAKLAAAAAAVVIAFGLGAEYGRRSSEPEVPAAVPIVDQVESPAGLMMTQFHMDGEDPFLNVSLAEEHPNDMAVLVKTWEY